MAMTDNTQITQMIEQGAHRMLFLTTLAFTICFGAWMLNGVLVTYLVENQIFNWGAVEIGWLLGIPVLTGAVLRLPAGILTDKYGGRPVFTLLLLLSAIPMFLLSQVDSFLGFALCSFGFGLTGAGFAVGVGFTSLWYPKRWQGTALGVFGAGNAGAAITTLFAPTLLITLTDDANDPERWRILPMIYAAVLVLMAVVFFLFTKNKKPTATTRTLGAMLKPLSSMRVWRFGLYYFLVFGCFVAFSQWLVPYFVNVYYMPLVTAGLLASLFSFPSGVIRALGGWLSDRFGGRTVMYWVLSTSVIVSFKLIVPKMDIYSPGQGIMAKRNGVVTEINETEIVVNGISYPILRKEGLMESADDKVLIFPTKEMWQEPVVKVGDEVVKKQLLAKGVTRIFFQANVWVFAFLVILIGIIWGIGKAAVYKHIPEYFPDQVGVVGGMVGVIGGLGGFFCPIIFGYLLEGTGLWTSSWMFILLLGIVSLIWMHRVIQAMMNHRHPDSMTQMDDRK